MMRRALLLVLIALIPLRVVYAASSIEDETERALRDYAKGKFDDAVARIEAAIRAQPDAKPASLVQAYKALASAQSARGNRRAARAAIAEALRLDPTVSFDPRRFPRAVVALLREVREAQRGTIVVTCDRATARVEVGGVPRGRCGVVVEVPLGKHKVVVIPESGPSKAQVVAVDRGERQEVVFTFGPPHGFLTVATVPPGASVAVDDKPFPKAPFARAEVAPGEHRVSVKLDGYDDESRTVVVGPAKEATLSVALKKKALAVVVSAPASASPRASQALRVVRRAPLAVEPIGKGRRIAGWTALGVGAATTVAGAVMHVIVARQGTELENAKLNGSYRLRDFDVVEQRNKASIAILIGGGVVATAGTLLLLIRGKAPAATGVSGFDLDLAPSPDLRSVGAGIEARWRF